jgi:transposase
MKRRHYTPEFKRSAVALVLEQGRTRQEAADNLGIGVSLIDNWLHQHRKSGGSAHTHEHAALKKRNAELERELRRLTMERDILKKATAYFAKDNL